MHRARRAAFIGFLVLNLGACLSTRADDPKPIAGASTFYLDSAELNSLRDKALNGDAGAALSIYQHYDFAKGDSISAFPWLQIAANRDNADAQYAMDYTCLYVSIVKNIQLARYWLRRASENGSVEATALLRELPQ